MTRVPRLPLLLALLPSVLSGCSGGDESDIGPGVGGPGTVDLRFFSGSMKAVDPRDPSQPLTVTEADVLFAAVSAGKLDAASGAVEDVGVLGVAYLDGDDLRFVDARLLTNATELQDRLLASLPAGAQELEVSPDFFEAADSRIFARYPNGDFEVTSVRGGASQPFPGEPLTDLHDFSTGALVGWLAREEGDLVRVDLDLHSSFVAATSDVKDVAATAAGVAYLVVDGFLQVYDVATDVLTDTGVALGSPSFDEVATVGGASDLWVLLIDEPTLEVLRIEPDASVETVFTETNAAQNDDVPASIEIAGDRLVLLYESQGGPVLLSVTKAGADPVHLGDGPFGNRLLSGSAVLFDDADELEAVVVQADGSNRKVFADAAWIGGSVETFQLEGVVLSDAFLVQGITASSHAGAQVHALDGADPRTLKTHLGTVPADVDALSFSLGAGDERLAEGEIDQGAPTASTDVFFVDGDEAGSLVRVTDTSDVSESPITF